MLRLVDASEDQQHGIVASKMKYMPKKTIFFPQRCSCLTVCSVLIQSYLEHSAQSWASSFLINQR